MILTMRRVGLVLMLGASAIGLAACSGTFATSYTTPSPGDAKSSWNVAKVEVSAPKSLTTTEQNSYIPSADIVWHGDRYGDRHAQVAEIVKAGISAGVTDLRGPESVVFIATIQRFHSLSPKAYYAAPSGTGVHSVAFDLVVKDARTGATLAGPALVEADMPARVAAEGGAGAVLPGDEWKSVIQSHIAATIRSWLGIGPDIRNRFSRMGA